MGTKTSQHPEKLSERERMCFQIIDDYTYHTVRKSPENSSSLIKIIYSRRQRLLGKVSNASTNNNCLWMDKTS